MSELNFPSERWAVFNDHVEEAGKRALAVCRARFPDVGEGTGMVELEAAARDGIMAIFDAAPSQASLLYAAACFIFANKLDVVTQPELIDNLANTAKDRASAH